MAAPAVGLVAPAGCAAGSQARAPAAQISAQAVAAASHVNPIPGGGDRTEIKVEQAVAMLHAGALNDRLALRATLNLEGLTMPGGVLTLGAWGEGFNDRRHPHTYAHELMVTWSGAARRFPVPVAVSISAGKGFVPFGSDDPMNRPAIRFPVNHHWSQILERAVTVLGLRGGPLTLEAAAFNGDEPERWDQWPRIRGRFGDSWSARALLSLGAGVELEASHARVHSPEHRPGAATDQEKWHASGRLDRALGSGHLYAMAEWARTTEAAGFFAFGSALGEGQWTSGPHRGYYRFERTDRPEEERLLGDPFRSLRPHLENSILGTTRWTIHTGGYSLRLDALRGRLRVEPLLEASFARVGDVGGGLFTARGFYGRKTLWSVTVGARLAAGMMHRMGRYGVSAEDAGRSLDHRHAP